MLLPSIVLPIILLIIMLLRLHCPLNAKRKQHRNVLKQAFEKAQEAQWSVPGAPPVVIVVNEQWKKFIVSAVRFLFLQCFPMFSLVTHCVCFSSILALLSHRFYVLGDVLSPRYAPPCVQQRAEVECADQAQGQVCLWLGYPQRLPTPPCERTRRD
jgi:hypothetical protein